MNSVPQVAEKEEEEDFPSECPEVVVVGRVGAAGQVEEAKAAASMLLLPESYSSNIPSQP